MKIKLDENLPLGMATALKNLGHNVHTTSEEGLVGKDDADIWAVSQHEKRIFRNEDVEQWAGYFVVATERKIRVVRK